MANEQVTPEDTTTTTEREGVDYDAIAKEVYGEPAQAEVVPQEVVTKEEAPAVQVSPQLALLARKEKALREREVALEASITERVKAALEGLRAKATANPSEYFRELGVEKPVELAADIYYNELGDDAPAEFKAKKQQIEAAKQLTEMKRLMSEWEKKQQEASATKDRDVYVSQLNGYLQSSLQDTPYLALEFEADQVGTLDAMCQAAANMMASGGPIPSAKQVAEALNGEIEKLATRYKSIGNNTQKAPPAAASKPVTQTLTSKQTSGNATQVEPAFDKERVIAELIADVKAGRMNT